MDRRGFVFLAAAVAAIAAALIFTAPFMAPYGTFTDLGGAAGSIDHHWGGNGFPDAVYALGDLLCHQDGSRSFVLNGSQMPICIRDTGILLGLLAGFLVSIPIGARIGDNRYAVIGVILGCFTVVEWVSERFVGDMPEMRFVTGMVTGIGVAVFLVWMLHRNSDPVYPE